MRCEEIIFSGHAVRRMFARAISADEVRRVLATGRVIATYTEDKPLPSMLLLGFVGGRPIHVLAARDAEQARCVVITCYEPDPAIWNEEFNQRRS